MSSSPVTDRKDSCESCGAVQFVKICERKNSSVVACENCGLQFVHPLPDEETIHQVHGEEMTGTQKGTPYYREYFEERKRRAGSYEKIYSNRLDLIERFLPTKGNLLDVGCGAGFFVKYALERGWNAHGIDLLPEYEVLARDELHIDNVKCGRLEDAQFPSESFSVVTLWDLIEHLPHPLAYLKQINRLLQPGGVIALWTPNTRNAVLLKGQWTGYGPGQHLYFFSQETLGRLLKQAGFEIIQARTTKTKKGLLLSQDSLTFEKRSKPESLGGRIGFALKRDLKNFFNPITYVNPLLDFAGYGFNLLILAKKTATPEEP